MRVSIVQIGNSKGIRIPKSVLAQCNIKDNVELFVRENEIVLKPLPSIPREGWAKNFARMAALNEDSPLIDESFDLDVEGWVW
ncbi:MAG: AbrB/MazE/SpoVT family DNA-binding domain-containing protein [Patescibacteria group bacterium]